MPPNSPRFLVNFMFLSILNGIAVGMGKVVTTLFAVHVGASAMEVGFISALESLGKVLVTLPAGFIIATYGARNVYFLSSVIPMLLTIALPWCSAWYSIGLLRGLASLCIPFRVVSMNSSFLQRLHIIGPHRAGWYRGARAIGLGLAGPALASLFTQNTSYLICFLFIGACFGAMAFYSQQFLPESDNAAAPAESDGIGAFGQVKAMLANAEVGESCLIEFVNSSANALFTTFIILVAIGITGMTQHDGVVLLVVEGVSSVSALFVLGYLFQRLSKRFAYGLSLVTAMGGLALVGSGTTLPVLALGTVLLSIGSSLIHLVNTLQLSKHTMSKSKIAGVYNLAGMLGGLFGATVGGLLSNVVNLQVLFLLWIPLLGMVAVVCRVRAVRERRRLVGVE